MISIPRKSGLFLLLFVLLMPQLASADLLSALRRAASTGAEVTDDISPGAFDRAAARMGVPTAPGARALDVNGARNLLLVSAPDLLRKLDTMTPAEQRFTLEIFEGARILKLADPDELARARMISTGGTDLLVAAQRYGDDVARPAAMLQIAENTGQLPPGALADFGRIAADRGRPFVAGWNKHIVPNWKPLMASGAIAACLAASETCIDMAGNVTGHTAETIGDLVGTIGSEAVTGTVKGVGEAVVSKIKGPDGLWFIGGLALLTMAMLVIIRFSRMVNGALRRMMGLTARPPAPPASKQYANRKPRRSLRGRDV